MDLSMRPGRRRAGSIKSGRLVAAIIYTPTCIYTIMVMRL